jgi:hypothetical protein
MSFVFIEGKQKASTAFPAESRAEKGNDSFLDFSSFSYSRGIISWIKSRQKA